MSDMSAVIVPKSDQINADDLIAGPRTITIAEVRINGGQEQPVSILMEGTEKVFRPCKSMSRVLVAAWGADARQYTGRSLTLYRDPEVKWGGMAVGGIRISHMSHIDKPLVLALTATKGSRKVTTVQPLRIAGQGGLTLEQARADLEAAQDVAELRATWSRKTMAPFRDQLQGRLDEIKGELAGAVQGRSDEQHGDQHDGTDDGDRITDDLIAGMGGK